MADESVILNGIDAVNGGYAAPALAVKDVSRLAQGLPIDGEHLAQVRAREESGQKSLGLESGRDPEQLNQAGWGVVLPHGADPAVLEALAPLLERRKAQAGDLYREFTAERAHRPGESANAFLARHGVAPGPARPTKVSYYLLLVGGPDRIPYRVQYDLGVNYAVGRVSFDEPEEYAAWARAVVNAEQSPAPARSHRLAFFATRHENDAATQLSADTLGAKLPSNLQVNPIPGWEITPAAPTAASVGALRDLLGGAGAPALLLTATHGMVFPLAHPRQLGEQGALVCTWAGPDSGPPPRDAYLAAENLPRDADLGGMITFHFACYGAGTPQLDDFPDASGNRRRIAPQPFMAALPRTLLAHGALAVVGHVARAWTCSFQWPGAGEQLVCFESTLRDLMEGRRLGHAMEYFAMKYSALVAALNGDLDDVKYGGTADDLALANLWTATNDARNFVIMGDPAARIR